MPRKKQEAAPVAAPSKKSAKPAKAEPKATKAAPKPKKTEVAPVPVKAAKKAAPSNPATKRAKHPDVSDDTVLAAFAKTPSGLLTKKELVAVCGGDDVSVSKAVNRLRGNGKIVVQGSTRSAVYRKA